MKRFQGHGYKDIYYLNDEKISSMYSQLTGNIERSSTQREQKTDISFTTKASNVILKLLGTELATEVEIGRNSTTTEVIVRKRELNDKFLEVIETINEEEYKDIFYLTEKYLKEGKRITAIGKGAFFILPSSNDTAPKELINVKFPVVHSSDNLILFSGKVISGNPDFGQFKKSDIDPDDIAAIQLRNAIYSENANNIDVNSIYSSRAFIILDPETIRDPWGLYHTYDKTLYFLGDVLEFEGNYFINPYALWGECVIL